MSQNIRKKSSKLHSKAEITMTPRRSRTKPFSIAAVSNDFSRRGNIGRYVFQDPQIVRRGSDSITKILLCFSRMNVMTRMSSRHITGSMFYDLMPCSRRVDMWVNSNKRHVIRNSYQEFSASSFVAVPAHKSDNYQQNATILPPP